MVRRNALSWCAAQASACASLPIKCRVYALRSAVIPTRLSARKSNDAQVITMGARVIGPELAKSILEVWLASEFAGGRSAPKVAKMNAVDERYRGARQGEREGSSC